MRIASGTGTLDSVSNVGNGTYTSTYTSSRVAGEIEIRARLGDNEFSATQNLTLTPGAATKLAIYQAPVSQRSGEVLSTQPKISVQDQYGNIVATDSGRVVTVAISAGNGGSLSPDPATATTSNGIATFTNVVLAGITTSNYVLSFTTPNLTSVNSGVLTVSSGSAQVTTSTFGVSDSSIVANGVTTSVVTVTIRDAKENALTASAGTLEMYVTAGHQGSIGAVTNNGDGTYTATYTSGTLVSNSTITAKLNGG
jgi:adhesin/invasin